MANLTPEETLRAIIDGSIVSLRIETLESTAAQKFKLLTNLEEVELPNLETVNGVGSFQDCPKVKNFNFPELKIFSQTNNCTAFERCTELETLVLPSYTNTLGGAFARYNVNMQAIDLSCNSMTPAYYGINESGTNTIILRKADGVCSINGINGITDRTPFASDGSGGTLYVPQALIPSYESATNWSTILSYTNNRILPIEGSQYEHYYADGTPIPE